MRAEEFPGQRKYITPRTLPSTLAICALDTETAICVLGQQYRLRRKVLLLWKNSSRLSDKTQLISTSVRENLTGLKIAYMTGALIEYA